MSYFSNKTRAISKKRQSQREMSIESDSQSQQSVVCPVVMPMFQWDQYYTPIRVSLLLNSNFDQHDKTTLWGCKLPQQTQRSISYLTIKKTTITRYYQETQQPECCIYLTSDGIEGLYDQTGDMTERICKFHIHEIFNNQLPFGDHLTKTKRVTYRMETDSYAYLPKTLSSLKFRLIPDNRNEYIHQPAKFMISLDFSITVKQEILHSQLGH